MTFPSKISIQFDGIPPRTKTFPANTKAGIIKDRFFITMPDGSPRAISKLGGIDLRSTEKSQTEILAIIEDLTKCRDALCKAFQGETLKERMCSCTVITNLETSGRLTASIDNKVTKQLTDKGQSVQQAIHNLFKAAATKSDPKIGNNEKMIQQINAAKKEGLKIGLFVGRKDNQSIPKQPGWLWVSVDIDMVNPPNKDHPHLQLDVNSETNAINGLSDKVVVDSSVIKFLAKPFATLHKLLSQKPESELIVETSTGMIPQSDKNEPEYDPERGQYSAPLNDSAEFYRKEEEAFDSWKTRIGQSKAEVEYQTFLKQMPEDERKQLMRMHGGSDFGLRLEFMRMILQRENIAPVQKDYMPEFLKRSQAYLEGLFDNVQLVQNKPNPYWDESTENDYWILSKPKKI